MPVTSSTRRTLVEAMPCAEFIEHHEVEHLAPEPGEGLGIGEDLGRKGRHRRDHGVRAEQHGIAARSSPKPTGQSRETRWIFAP